MSESTANPLRRRGAYIGHRRRPRPTGAGGRCVVAVVFGLVLLGGCRDWWDDRPDILLVTLDTTRADHLGVYGYDRPTSPRLDAFAEGALVYEQALSTATWTLPAHASLFTGKFPSSHGARYDRNGGLHLLGEEQGNIWDRYYARTISPGERTLASLLRDAGYATGAVVAGPWMTRDFGLDGGFDYYDDEGVLERQGRWASAVTQRALAWLDATPERPRFLFLNYYDPHKPHKPPESFARLFRSERADPTDGVAGADLTETIDLYDAEIRYMDEYLGRLFDGLRERGLFEDTWILITADHGTLLGEHGEVDHGGLPYSGTVRVPLVIKEPGRNPPTGRVRDRVQLADFLPWIAERLDIPVPQGIQGDAPPGIEHPFVVESRTLPAASPRGTWRALYQDDWKLMWSSQGNNMLFDLAADPNESANVIADHPELARQMDELLTRYLVSLPPPGPEPPPRDLDAKTREALRAVGYLE